MYSGDVYRYLNIHGRFTVFTVISDHEPLSSKAVTDPVGLICPEAIWIHTARRNPRARSLPRNAGSCMQIDTYRRRDWNHVAPGLNLGHTELACPADEVYRFVLLATSAAGLSPRPNHLPDSRIDTLV